MLGKGRLNIWAYDRYSTNVLSYYIYNNYFNGYWTMYFVYIFHFLVSPRYYSTFGGFMRFSIFGNLKDYYYEHHGIGNSFHNHVHVFRTISHPLQGMVHIRLDMNDDFSLKAHYFA